jgi:thioredoxin|nr:MAG TPA: TRX family protein [Caudoviricetes sp.]
MLKLLFIGAPWCSQCPQAKANFERAMQKFPYLGWEYVDVEANPDLGRKCNIMSVPTVIALHEGVEVARMGTGTTLQYKQMIEGAIN